MNQVHFYTERIEENLGIIFPVTYMKYRYKNSELVSLCFDFLSFHLF